MYSVESKLEDVTHLGHTLELSIKDAQYNVSGTRTSFETFKEKISRNVERIQNDLLSLQKSVFQLEGGNTEFQASVVGKQEIFFGIS